MSVNKVILLGNIGQELELKYTSGGKAYVRLSIATTEKWKNNEGDYQEKTTWHRVTFWNKQAEVIAEYMKKGDQIYVEGRINNGSYEKEGVKHYTTDIIGASFSFVGNKKKEEKEEKSLPINEEEEADDDDLPF